MAWKFNPFTGNFDYYELNSQVRSGTVTLPGNGAINLETVDLSNGNQYKIFLRIYSDDFEVYRSMEITVMQTDLLSFDLIVENLYQNGNFDVQFQPTGIISNVSMFIQSNYSREVTVSYVRLFHA